MSIVVQNFTDTSAALTYLRTLLVPTYFASATYDSSTGTSFKDSDNNVLLMETERATTNSVWRLYKSSSSVITLNYHATNQADQTYVSKIVSCDGGVLIHLTGSDRSTPGGDLIITRGNDGKTVIIGNTNYTARGTTGTDQVYRYSKIDMIKWGDDTSSNKRLTFTGTASNQTQMIPFTTYCPVGYISYTPDAYWIPFGEFYEVRVGKFLGPNDMEYVTNGYWAIRDHNSLAG